MKKLILIAAFLISSIGISQVTKEDFKELSNRNGFPIENILTVSLTSVDYYNCGNKSNRNRSIDRSLNYYFTGFCRPIHPIPQPKYQRELH